MVQRKAKPKGKTREKSTSKASTKMRGQIKPEAHTKKGIVEEIELVKSKLPELDAILKNCWGAKQDSRVTFGGEPNAVLSVNPFNAAAVSADAFLRYLDKPVEALVYSIRLSEENKSEMAAQAVEDGYRRMVEALQALFGGERASFWNCGTA